VIPKVLRIQLGAMSDPIKKQLEEQGLRASTEALRVWQRAADARVMLSVGGLLTEAESQRVGRRLLKKMSGRLVEGGERG